MNEKICLNIYEYIRTIASKKINAIVLHKESDTMALMSIGKFAKYAYSKGYQFEIISDIGSGINYNKKGLKTLIYKINNKEVSKIVILYKDRLVRFGYEIISYLCELNGIEIEIVDNTSISKKQELTEDLIQIITVFASKLYGSRSKKTKKLLEEVKNND